MSSSPPPEGGQFLDEALPVDDGPARDLMTRARAQLAQTLDTVRGGGAPELASLAETAAAFVASLEGDDNLMAHALNPRHVGPDLARHMSNVAVFAVKIGMCADFPLEKLVAVGLAGLVHDIGLATLPPDLLEKADGLTGADKESLTQHPERGARVIRAAGGNYGWLAVVVAQEHEREDGSGYPKGLRGEDIHELAKVIGIADVYEALTHPRAYRRRMSPLDAVKEIITSERRAFAEWALKGLIRGLSTFPVGSLVRLNSREIGRVKSTNPMFPLRPVVQVVAGAAGEPLATPRVVDLAQNSLMYIVDAYTADE